MTVFVYSTSLQDDPCFKLWYSETAIAAQSYSRHGAEGVPVCRALAMCVVVNVLTNSVPGTLPIAPHTHHKDLRSRHSFSSAPWSGTCPHACAHTTHTHAAHTHTHTLPRKMSPLAVTLSHCQSRVPLTKVPLYSGFPSVIFMFCILVLAMSTGMEATVVMKPLIILAVKWHLMLSSK